jgi:hypothetical protein
MDIPWLSLARCQRIRNWALSAALVEFLGRLLARRGGCRASPQGNAIAAGFPQPGKSQPKIVGKAVDNNPKS